MSHPNIITVFDAGVEKDTPFLVMELVDGTALDNLISFPLDKIITFVTRICSALDYAHHQGIVHRDLKPGNILVEKNDQVKLMDFGLARSVVSRMTVEGAITGTVF